MTFVKDKSWKKYKDIINKFIDNDAGKQKFLWLHKIDQLAAYGEDSGPVYIPITLEGLFHYNYIKTWANNRLRDTISGELQYDDQVLYISANQLRERGYLTPGGYWDFNWAEDRFIVNSKVAQPGYLPKDKLIRNNLHQYQDYYVDIGMKNLRDIVLDFDESLGQVNTKIENAQNTKELKITKEMISKWKTLYCSFLNSSKIYLLYYFL